MLIVDDDPVSAAILWNICTELGAHCVAASSGQEAVHWLEHQVFDFVLLDRNMPCCDGFCVLQQIRTHFCEAEMPVVVVTADHDQLSIVEAFEKGANDFITKPFDAVSAQARIRTHLRMQRMQRQLSESRIRYELAMQGTNDGIWDWDLESDRVYFSPRWQAMLGMDERELYTVPDHWLIRIHEDDRARIERHLESHLLGLTNHFESELRMQHRDGKYRWMLCRGKAVFDNHGQATRIAGSLTDVTEGKSVDPLTGLPNRALFLERVARRFAQFQREPGRMFAIFYIDIDDFKHVNDSYGHAAGDAMLVAVASQIEAQVRRADSVVARLGGDEFAILVEDLQRAEDADIIANRLINAIRTPVAVAGDEQVSPAASVGVAFASPSMQSTDGLLRTADSAMYQAKKQGKNRYSLSPTDASSLAVQAGD